MPAAVEFQNWVFWLIQKLRRSGEYAKLRAEHKATQGDLQEITQKNSSLESTLNDIRRILAETKQEQRERDAEFAKQKVEQAAQMATIDERHRDDAENYRRSMRRINVRMNSMDNELRDINSKLTETRSIIRKHAGIVHSPGALQSKFVLVDVNADIIRENEDEYEYRVIRGQAGHVDAKFEEILTEFPCADIIVTVDNVQPLTIYHELKKRMELTINDNDFNYTSIVTALGRDEISLIVAEIANNISNGNL